MTFKLLRVGTDAEFFLRDAKTNEPVTAIGRFGGTKEKPLPILNLGEEGFCIQEDNVMPEVNIPAADKQAGFTVNAQKILSWLRTEAKKQGLIVDISPSMSFDPKQLEHPQAQHIGCEPDYCVWTRTENEFDPAKRDMLRTLRSAGGHIHISFANSEGSVEQADRELLVMFCDLTLGVPSVLLDGDMERKKLYGKAGSFRFKDYGANAGIEYRVLSNFWFKSRRYMEWAFAGAWHAVQYMNDKVAIRTLYDMGEEIQSIINTQDKERAFGMVNQWGMALPL